LFREALIIADAIKLLFDTFGETWEKQGVSTKTGSILVASFVEVPRQRNIKKNDNIIKNENVPPEWHSKPKKLSQKDTGAAWTK